MKLQQLLKKSGMEIGLASALLLTGCEGMSDEQVGGLVLGRWPYSKSASVGQSMSWVGGALVSSDNASRSRSQVNVYNQAPQSQQVVVQQPKMIPKYRIDENGDGKLIGPYPSREVVQGVRIFKHNGIVNTDFISCNYAKDLNGNGIIEHDEYIGLKEKFYNDENINIRVLLARKAQPNSFTIKLFDPEGKLGLIKTYEQEVGKVVLNFQPYKLKSGNYVFSAEIDNQFLGSHHFEVIQR